MTSEQNFEELKRNSSPVPEICKPHLPGEYKSSFVHNVLGDGACCIRCLIAHLGIKDEELENHCKEINMFMFKNQPNIEPKFSYPLKVTYGPNGKKKTFKTADEHFAWLKTNKDSLKVWRECGDVKAISNQYNLNIKVLRLDKKGKLELPIQEYEPDDEYKWEDGKETHIKTKPTMILINKSDHFALIVKDDTTQNNLVNKKHATENKNTNLKENDSKPQESETINELRKKIEELEDKIQTNQCQCKETGHQPPTPQSPKPKESLVKSERQKIHEKPKLKEQQKKPFSEKWICNICKLVLTTSPILERHMKNKHGQTEDKESGFRFSSLLNCDTCDEVFSTKELLRQHELNTHREDVEMIEAEASNSDQEEEMDTEDRNKKGRFKCKICKLVQSTKSKLENHMKNHEEDADWICDGIPLSGECSFQSNDKTLLEHHLKELGHISSMLEINDIDENLKQDLSTEQVENPADSDQSKILYQKTFKCPFCSEKFQSNKQVGQHRKDIHPTFKPCRYMDQCKFQSECFYSHSQIPENKFRCYQCGNEFNTKHEMMIHRKSDHSEDIKICQKFVINQCQKETQCWWAHEDKPLVFWQAPENLAPPASIWFKQKIMQPQVQHQTISGHPLNQEIKKMLSRLEESLNLIKQMIITDQ